ncbi:MAG TPA: AraC family transcriptional regulator ligand-binding domain-containing protein [Rhodopila sp.]|nr:AraC family transcriptional regulator ligand-binding domain-containing protein [Rhodopila sp.]
MLEEQGISLEAALGRTNLKRHSPGQTEPIVPIAWLGKIFKAAAAASAQPEFGLSVGVRAGSRIADWTQGSTPNNTHLGASLLRIISQPTIFPQAFLNLTVFGDTCAISCITLQPGIVARDQLTDCAIGFAAGALRTLCGPHWRPRGFRFSHGPPRDPSRYAVLLQAPVSFDTDSDAMEFDTQWLDRDCPSSLDQTSAASNRRGRHRDLVGEVRQALASWNAVQRPSGPAIASAIGLQSRTLNRLLRKSGTNFNQLREAALYETARQMLGDANTPVLSIAWCLGYADASTFSRAFRRWSGKTPTEWREGPGSRR